MRSLLFFDLPTLTSKNRRDYRKFVKDIVRLGYYRVQESVFVKMHINPQNVDSTINQLNKVKPPNGSLFIITITEQQFSKMKILLGELEDEVVTSDDRVLIL